MGTDVEERQAAAAGGAVVLAVGIPVAIIAVGWFVYGWLCVVGNHDAHAVVWGWLSHRETWYDDHGRPDGRYWTPNGRVIGTYYLSVITLYLLYQVAEGGAALFRAFRRAMT